MESPTAILVSLVAAILAVALCADLAMYLWSQYAATMANASRALGVEWREPQVAPQWGWEQAAPALHVAALFGVVALVIAVVRALREREE
jgi:cell division protein FtsX